MEDITYKLERASIQVAEKFIKDTRYLSPLVILLGTNRQLALYFKKHCPGAFYNYIRKYYDCGPSEFLEPGYFTTGRFDASYISDNYDKFSSAFSTVKTIKEYGADISMVSLSTIFDTNNMNIVKYWLELYKPVLPKESSVDDKLRIWSHISERDSAISRQLIEYMLNNGGIPVNKILRDCDINKKTKWHYVTRLIDCIEIDDANKCLKILNKKNYGSCSLFRKIKPLLYRTVIAKLYWKNQFTHTVLCSMNKQWEKIYLRPNNILGKFAVAKLQDKTAEFCQSDIAILYGITYDHVHEVMESRTLRDFVDRRSISIESIGTNTEPDLVITIDIETGDNIDVYSNTQHQNSYETINIEPGDNIDVYNKFIKTLNTTISELESGGWFKGPTHQIKSLLKLQYAGVLRDKIKSLDKNISPEAIRLIVDYDYTLIEFIPKSIIIDKADIFLSSLIKSSTTGDINQRLCLLAKIWPEFVWKFNSIYAHYLPENIILEIWYDCPYSNCNDVWRSAPAESCKWDPRNVAWLLMVTSNRISADDILEKLKPDDAQLLSLLHHTNKVPDIYLQRAHYAHLPVATRINVLSSNHFLMDYVATEVNTLKIKGRVHRQLLASVEMKI